MEHTVDEKRMAFGGGAGVPLDLKASDFLAYYRNQIEETMRASRDFWRCRGCRSSGREVETAVATREGFRAGQL